MTFENGAWTFDYWREFEIRGGEWTLEYRAAEKKTIFTFFWWRDEDPDVTTHELPGYVSHDRFPKLLPFL